MGERHYTAHITDTTTGETRQRDMGETLFGEGSEFWWSYGNFGCDCNRAMEFIRASGREPEEHESPCGEGRYRVKCVADDGAILYQDEAPHAD